MKKPRDERRSSLTPGGQQQVQRQKEDDGYIWDCNLCYTPNSGKEEEEELMDLHPVDYVWGGPTGSDEKDRWFLADEAREIVPEHFTEEIGAEEVLSLIHI